MRSAAPFFSDPASTITAQSGGGRENSGASAGRRSLALRLDPHRAGPPEHRNRVNLVGERAGIARHRVALEPSQAERVGLPRQRRLDQTLRALVDQPFVGPMNEKNRVSRGGRLTNASAVVLLIVVTEFAAPSITARTMPAPPPS